MIIKSTKHRLVLLIDGEVVIVRRRKISKTRFPEKHQRMNEMVKRTKFLPR